MGLFNKKEQKKDIDDKQKEMHNDDIDKAKEIALSNLAKDSNYYTRLDMVEYKSKKKKGRNDLPTEVKKNNFKDKENQMKNAPKKKVPKKDK